jgi:hypothetical protein
MSQTWTAAQVLTAAQMATLSGTVDGYATTATAAGTTTLTVASLYQQFFTGSTTQTVVLPVTLTLTLGYKYRVVNNSSGVVTVQSSGANTVYAVPAGGDVIFTCILITGTTAASWDYKDHKAASATSFIGAIAYGAVNLAYSSTPTAISSLTTEIVDTDAYHSTASNTSRMTIPSGKDGKYRMELILCAAAASPNFFIYAYKNGVAITEGIVNGKIGSKTTTINQDDIWSVGLTLTGVATDYFEFFIASGSGTPTIDKARYSFTYLGA